MTYIFRVFIIQKASHRLTQNEQMAQPHTILSGSQTSSHHTPESILDSRGGGGACDFSRGDARPWSALKVSAEKAPASQKCGVAELGGEVCDAGGDGTAVAALLTSTSGARRTEPSSPARISSRGTVRARSEHSVEGGETRASDDEQRWFSYAFLVSACASARL